MIDFATLVFHYVGSVITKQGGCALYGIGAAASLYCVFPLGSSAERAQALLWRD